MKDINIGRAWENDSGGLPVHLFATSNESIITAKEEVEKIWRKNKIKGFLRASTLKNNVKEKNGLLKTLKII